MGTSYNRNKQEKSKAKLYWTIGIVLGIIVAALLIWNSGIFQKTAVAATVGDQKFTVPELSYYYNAQISSKRQEVQMYEQFGIQNDYNTDLEPEEQYYNEAEGVTYAEYFLNQALSALQEDTLLCTEARKAGYTLSQAGQDSVADNMDALHMYSTQSGYSESAYLKLLYGQYMTKSLFKEMLSNSILANEYAAEKQSGFTYTDQELEEYYNEDKASLDTYDYRYCFISGQAESTTDEDGNTADPTEEETAAAMADAKAKADSIIDAVQSGTAFNEAAAENLDADTAEPYADAEYNHATGVLGQNLESSYREWLQDDARTDGEIAALEMTSGYYVVQFLGRERSEDTYQTINYRSILILSETTDTEVPTTDASAVTGDASAEDATETEIISLPSSEQLAAAEEQANALLDEWKAGEATAESFGALASASSDDAASASNGGLTENANKDALSSELADWLFADGRKAGDTTVLEYKDSSGRVAGYQVLYVDSLGEIAWRYAATTALQAVDYQNWYNETELNYPAELTEKGREIAGLSAADTENAEEAADVEEEAPAEEAEDVAQEATDEAGTAMEEEANSEAGADADTGKGTGEEETAS